LAGAEIKDNLNYPSKRAIKVMPRKPTKRVDGDQSKRFIETAEEVGADQDEDALNRAFKAIVPPKPNKAPSNGR
jgi:hypothetical protein